MSALAAGATMYIVTKARINYLNGWGWLTSGHQVTVVEHEFGDIYLVRTAGGQKAYVAAREMDAVCR